MTQVYIAGALSGPADNTALKAFYEELAKVVRKCGAEPYLPHQHTDPHEHPDVDPRDVYNRNKAKIEESALVLAYAGEASSGLGVELEIANGRLIPVVLLVEKGKSVSRMLFGHPAVREIVVSFLSIDTALDDPLFVDALEATIASWI